eukprot:30738-Pelagococcus_subviridis.AAC.7
MASDVSDISDSFHVPRGGLRGGGGGVGVARVRRSTAAITGDSQSHAAAEGLLSRGVGVAAAAASSTAPSSTAKPNLDPRREVPLNPFHATENALNPPFPVAFAASSCARSASTSALFSRSVRPTLRSSLSARFDDGDGLSASLFLVRLGLDHRRDFSLHRLRALQRRDGPRAIRRRGSKRAVERRGLPLRVHDDADRVGSYPRDRVPHGHARQRRDVLALLDRLPRRFLRGGDAHRHRVDRRSRRARERVRVLHRRDRDRVRVDRGRLRADGQTLASLGRGQRRRRRGGHVRRRLRGDRRVFARRRRVRRARRRVGRDPLRERRRLRGRRLGAVHLHRDVRFERAELIGDRVDRVRDGGLDERRARRRARLALGDASLERLGARDRLCRRRDRVARVRQHALRDVDAVGALPRALERELRGSPRVGDARFRLRAPRLDHGGALLRADDAHPRLVRRELVALLRGDARFELLLDRGEFYARLGELRRRRRRFRGG